MKVRMVRDVGGFATGAIVDLNDHTAEAWIRSKFAEPIERIEKVERTEKAPKAPKEFVPLNKRKKE
jgi:hypothetical protein